MKVQIVVPDLGESISEVEVGQWIVSVGESVERDSPVVDVESEKATVEVPAPEAGVLISITREPGQIAAIGEVLGTIDTEAKATAGGEEKETPPASEPNIKPSSDNRVMPAAKRIMSQGQITPDKVTPTGPGGRTLKEDAMAAGNATAATAPTTPGKPTVPQTIPSPSVSPTPTGGSRDERRQRMSPLRRTIAKRLVEAKQTTAMLTTFNEVDMSAVKALRSQVKDAFLGRHGVKLGFMSFFVKAVVESLHQVPGVGARIDGTDLVYPDYCDIGIAIGGGKGLVVPVLRNAETMTFAQIETAIVDYSFRANEGSITMDELEGGTFTISNGGVYGSMMSTPILNPPQSGILGLHAIKDRPVVIGNEIVIRPIMYLALSYDHRVVDGKEAVTFLKGIKERIENPGRIMLKI